MDCSYKDCKYHGEFYLVGLLPAFVKRGQEAWSDAIYCRTHTMVAETHYADVLPLGKTPAGIMRIGLIRRLALLQELIDGNRMAMAWAKLRALRIYVENAEEGEFSDHQTV